MYNEKYFKELEVKAHNDHLFVDPQIVAAAPGYVAAVCLVSDKTGKRVYRAAEGKNISNVMECVMTLALSAYYNLPIPELSKNANTPQDEQQVKMSTADGTSVAANTASETAGAAGKDNPTAASITRPVENTTVSVGNTDTVKDAPANFRVLIGNYKERDDNYIEQMLHDEKGRKFLKSVMSVTNPTMTIKPYVDQTKAYLEYHGIKL